MTYLRLAAAAVFEGFDCNFPDAFDISRCRPSQHRSPQGCCSRSLQRCRSSQGCWSRHGLISFNSIQISKLVQRRGGGPRHIVAAFFVWWGVFDLPCWTTLIFLQKNLEFNSNSSFQGRVFLAWVFWLKNRILSHFLRRINKNSTFWEKCFQLANFWFCKTPTSSISRRRED